MRHRRLAVGWEPQTGAISNRIAETWFVAGWPQGDGPMPSFTSRRGFATCAALFCHLPQAGTIEQAVLLAEPQMQIKAGAVDGCGFRIKGMPQGSAGTGSVVMFDTSFNLYATGMSLLKGGAVQVSMRQGKAGPPVNRPIQSFWFMAPDRKPTTPMGGKFVAAETPGYLLYGVPVDALVGLFGAVMESSTLTVGVRIKGESIDRIYAGAVNASDADKQQSHQCMDQLLKRMRADPDSPEQDSKR